MGQAQIFGTDLISYVLIQQQVQKEFTKLIIKVLNDEKVKKETISVLEYVV